MRNYEVKYYISKNGVVSDEYETEIIESESAEQAIELLKDYLVDQVIQNSDFTAEIKNGDVVVVDIDDKIVETYCNFSTLPAIQEARSEAGLSRAEMSRKFEIPIRTLENWEAGKRMLPHWAEKLIIEKLELMSPHK